MCGRYTMKSNPHAVATLFGLAADPELKPRYNVSPTQMVPIIREVGGRRAMSMMRWGLIPSWAKDPKIVYSLINARSETAATKPAFRTAFKRRRCLFATDGFYEWKKVGAQKLPVHFRRQDEAPFAFAGLWECWHPKDGDPIESCTILTTEANELVRPYHDRMPVILKEKDFDEWLDPTSEDAEALMPLLAKCPWPDLEIAPANPITNSPRHDGPDCLIAPDAPLVAVPKAPTRSKRANK